MAADGKDTQLLKRLQRYIRLASIVFLIVGISCLAVAILLLIGLGGFIGALAGGESLGAMLLALCQAVFFLLLGGLGLRAVRDRFRVKPFCALAVILAVAIAVEQMMSSRAVIASSFLSGRFGILYLLFSVIAILAALASAALMGYNREHPGVR